MNFSGKNFQNRSSVEDLSCMILRIHFLDYPCQDTVFIKDEGPSDRSHHRLSVHLLLSPCSECLKHLGRSIRQKSERKLIFLTELLVRSRAVLAYPHNIVSLCNQRVITVPDAARFRRAAARIVLRIKIDIIYASGKVWNRIWPSMVMV